MAIFDQFGVCASCLLLFILCFAINMCSATEVARRGMVVTANELASRAGVETLSRGGNAVDAALTVQAMLGLVAPQWSGLGGGCLILVHNESDGQTTAIDGREEAPSRFHGKIYCNDEDCLLNPDCACVEGLMPLSGTSGRNTGGLSVGVPGTPAAFLRLIEEHGSGNLSLAELVAPAVELARSGFPMPDALASNIRSSASRLRLFPASAKLFLNKDGTGPVVEAGETFTNEEYALTLERLAAGGRDYFYTGETARAIVEAVQGATNAAGKRGVMELSDMEGYRAVRRAPLRSRFLNGTHEIVGFPPPTSGGIVVAQTLNVLEDIPLRALGAESAEAWGRIADSMNLAFADRNKYLADPDFVDVPVEGLINEGYCAKRAQAELRDDGRAVPTPAQWGIPDGASDESLKFAVSNVTEVGTTHFSIAADGLFVSVTSTVQWGMGSAVVVPGYGFLLNDELDDFDPLLVDTESGRFYANGPESGRRPRRTALDMEDRVTFGGKRPRSSMTPTLVFNRTTQSNKGGAEASYVPWMALGSPGGSTIPSTVLAGLLYSLVFEYNAQEATDAPRLLTRNDGVQSLEPALFASVGEEMRTAGFNATLYSKYGQLMVAQLCSDGLFRGAADTTRIPEASAAPYN